MSYSYRKRRPERTILRFHKVFQMKRFHKTLPWGAEKVVGEYFKATVSVMECFQDGSSIITSPRCYISRPSPKVIFYVGRFGRPATQVY